MTLDEAFRRIVRGHLALILICLILPVAGAYVAFGSDTAQWQASVRLQVGSAGPSSSTEAESLNARVLAIATTESVVTRALKDADVGGLSAATVAEHRISASRLGDSSIVELSVRDARKSRARAVVTALADQVVAFMNQGDRSRVNQTISRLDDTMSELTKQRTQLLDRLSKLFVPQQRSNVKLQLGALQAEIAQLADERSSLVVADAGREQVVALDTTTPDAQRLPSPLVPRLALAALLGLLLGLGLAGALEGLRPKISDSRALADLLETPFLGQGDEPAEVAPSLALAARRQGINVAVLVPADQADEHLLAAVVGRLNLALRAGASTAVDSLSSARIASHRDGAGHEDGPAELYPTGQDDYPFDGVRCALLSDTKPWEELTAGIVVVSSGPVLRKRLDGLEDLIKVSLWPVIGVMSIDKREAANR